MDFNKCCTEEEPFKTDVDPTKCLSFSWFEEKGTFGPCFQLTAIVVIFCTISTILHKSNPSTWSEKYNIDLQKLWQKIKSTNHCVYVDFMLGFFSLPVACTCCQTILLMRGGSPESVRFEGIMLYCCKRKLNWTPVNISNLEPKDAGQLGRRKSIVCVVCLLVFLCPFHKVK